MNDSLVKNNFVKSYRNMLSDDRLSPIDKIVYQAVQFYYELNQKDKRCTASEKNIAELCHVSARSVIRSLKELRLRHFINIHKADGDKLIITLNDSDYENMMVKKLPSSPKIEKKIINEPLPTCHTPVTDCHPIYTELLIQKENVNIKNINNTTPTCDNLSHPTEQPPQKFNSNFPKEMIQQMIDDPNYWPSWVDENNNFNLLSKEYKDIIRTHICFRTGDKQSILQDIKMLPSLKQILSENNRDIL